MSPEQWERAKELYGEALECDSADRAAFLQRKTTDDVVREEVRRLLAEQDRLGKFLSTPPFAEDRLVPEPPVKQFAPGEVLAERFRIVRFIAAGGMGEVYEAEDLVLKENLAIKTIRPEILRQKNSLERFKREVQLARRVTHPNICRVFDLFWHKKSEGAEHSVVLFVSMELLRGETLSDRIRRAGRFRIEEALPVIEQIASGLEAAHRAGVVHRDLKPGNVILAPDADQGQTRSVITDFGLALRTGADRNKSLDLSATQGAFGTPAYMAPEQIEGREVTKQADIYALGLIIYEMVTGEHAFPADTPLASAAKRLSDPIVPPKRFAPELSDAWDQTIIRCLQRDPNARCSSAMEVANALSRQNTDPPVAPQIVTELGPQPVLRKSPPVQSVPLSSTNVTQVVGKRSIPWKIVIPVAVILGASLTASIYFSRGKNSLTEKDTIVLSDFTNTTGDSVFDGTLRQGLTVQLEQSPFLSLISDQHIQQTLRLMGQPAETKLTPKISQEICQRTGSKVVIEGSIAQIGTQYSLILKTVNCSNGESLASTEARASDKNHVLDALGTAAAEIRNKLGESLASVQKFDTPLAQATTSSLEALQAYSLGRKYIDGDVFDPAAAIPLFQRAIQMDPNFAMAYASLGTSYANLKQGVLAAENTRKAYNLRERVSEQERFYIESHYQTVVLGDLEKARQVCELWANAYPRDWVPPDNLSDLYASFGQYEEALAQRRKAVHLQTESPPDYGELIDNYLYLDRLQEAHAIAEEANAKNSSSFWLRVKLYKLAFLQNDTSSMQQQIAWSTGKPGVEDMLLAYESDTAAYFGKLGIAREFSRRAVESAERTEEKEVAAGYLANAALREALFGNAVEARQRAASALGLSTGQRVQFVAALALAFAGDAGRAQRLADDLGKRSPENTLIHFNYLPTIRAQLAICHNDSSRAMQVLQTAAPYDLGLQSGLYPIYVRGETYLAAHQGREAAAEFQKILDHRGIVLNEPIGALAHLQMGRAYALQGEGAKARSAFQDFLTLWKYADPDIPIFVAAKAEYAKLN